MTAPVDVLAVLDDAHAYLLDARSPAHSRDMVAARTAVAHVLGCSRSVLSAGVPVNVRERVEMARRLRALEGALVRAGGAA